MLEALRFCKGSVATKDFMPALTHFIIENGHVRGFNGVLALSSPIPFDIKCNPKADILIKAIAQCTETIQLAMTPAGRLSIKSGKFKCLVPCVEGGEIHPKPEGEIVNFDGDELLKGLKAVAPFIGDDASRRWSNGVLVEKGSLFATNNKMLVQYWAGLEFPCVVNIPREAIKEMLRINESPVYAQLTKNSISFHYSGDRWIRTQLYDHTGWPDLSPILDKPSVQTEIDQELFEGLEALKPFVDKAGLIIFQQQCITTHDDPAEATTFDLPWTINVEGRYNIAYLELLKDTAKTSWPAPCLFQNDRLRGALIGLKP